MTREEREALERAQHRHLGRGRTAEAMAAWAPSMADDPALVAWFARMQRLAASPGEARDHLRAR